MSTVVHYRGCAFHTSSEARARRSTSRNHLRDLVPAKRTHVDLRSIILETDITGRKPDPAKVQYEIRVATGDTFGAGTDANVYVVVFGTNGDSGTLQLTSKYTNLFERGKTDCFIIDARADLGELTRLHIKHDDTGFGAAWLLDSVFITNLETEASYIFICNEWLDNEHGTSRDLRAMPEDCEDEFGGGTETDED